MKAGTGLVWCKKNHHDNSYKSIDVSRLLVLQQGMSSTENWFVNMHQFLENMFATKKARVGLERTAMEKETSGWLLVVCWFPGCWRAGWLVGWLVAGQ